MRGGGGGELKSFGRRFASVYISTALTPLIPTCSFSDRNGLKSTQYLSLVAHLFWRVEGGREEEPSNILKP